MYKNIIYKQKTEIKYINIRNLLYTILYIIMKIKDLITPDETNKIKKLIQEYGKNNELEVSLFSNKDTSSHLLTLERFNHLHSVLSIVTAKNDAKLQKTMEQSLDVIFGIKPKQNDKTMINYRIQITDINKINEYLGMLHMRKNHLVVGVLTGFIEESKGKNTYMSIQKKTKDVSNYVTIEDIYMRFKLDKEEELTADEIKKLQNIKKYWDMNDYDIIYRFKERTSYFLQKDKNLFRLDLTNTRTSNNINNIDKSPSNYEIEVECDPKDKSSYFSQIFDIGEFIIKVIQQSNYIVTKSMNSQVLERYRAILGTDQSRQHLYGRQAVSLEIQHVVDFLPNKYAVTDKADGDRFFLIVLDGRCYLISSNLVVKDTGLEVDKKYNGSILDGEFIFLPKYNKYLYMSFDCLVLAETNIRDEHLLMKRLERADELVYAINKTGYVHKYMQDSKLDFNNSNKILDWHTKNITEFYDDIDKELNSKKSNIIVRRKYFIESNGVADNEIFKYSDLMWKLYNSGGLVKCPYLLDGLIYQPLDQKYIAEADKSKHSDYKWKPAKKNSVDFYVEFEKDKKTNKILTIYDNSVPDVVKNKPYQILNLFVGLSTKGVEKPVLFNQEEGISQCYLYLDEEGMARTEDGKQISDKTVVEFYFNTDSDAPNPYKWIPMKTRFDKTESVQKFGRRYGNYQDTAMKVWHSIINPVKMSDFTALTNDSTYEKYFKELKGRIDFSLIKLDKEQVYYQKRKQKIVEDMRQFHNWVKSNLIYTTMNGRMYDDFIKYKILDIGCGVGGDIGKYYYCVPDLLVGIDPDITNLTVGNDCAIARYHNYKKGKKDFPPMFFIQANPANLLQWDEQIKLLGRMSSDNKHMFEKFFTWDKNSTKFDRVNLSFVIHYLLSDENAWNNFCQNLNMYMRDGALLTITTFDGDRVSDKLKGRDRYVEHYDENGEKKVLFDIVKKYDEKSKDKLGQAIDVHMGWLSEEGNYITEFLVYPEFLIKSLKEKCNIELMETGSFEDMFNDNRQFLELSSQIEEDSYKKKFYEEVYKYYTPSDLNVKCYEYTFLQRYYIFRKTEPNLEEIRKVKANAKRDTVQSKKGTFSNKDMY